MDFRLIGSILLITGTSIGAGILAVPVVTAAGGFYLAAATLLFSWAAMTVGAFYLLEVNLRCPQNSNIITMAQQTLGLPGQAFAWITYLLLLYSLISAYLGGGSDVVKNLLRTLHLHFPDMLNTLLFLGVLGIIVYLGIRTVDRVNRILMLAKFFLLALVIILGASHVESQHLVIGSFSAGLSSMMVVITAFGFATIIPSLRIYLKSDIHKLRIAIFSGSLITFFCYFLWLLVVQGNIPNTGNNGLLSIAASNDTVGHLANALILRLQTPLIATFIHIFTSICMLTSFLGVSLSLSDFLSDGLQVEKRGKGNFLIYGLTFIPPIILVWFIPKIFILALAYGGIFCVLLLILLPVLMAWRSRRTAAINSYHFFGGKLLIKVTLIVCFILLAVGFFVHN